VTQGKFILLLEVFIGTVIAIYFGVLRHFEPFKVVIILLFSLIGIGAAMASPGSASASTRSRTRARPSRASRASPTLLRDPAQAGMSIGMLLISVELFMMLCILLFLPRDYAGSCFIGFAIGESLGASALRIAGGISRRSPTSGRTS